MAAAEHYPQTHAETVDDWHDWLEEHHETERGTWLVSWKKHTGRPAIAYDEAVEEALCFGWVDSLARALDDDRSMLLYTPRKASSNWSRSNKQRVERLLAAGRMRSAGLRMVELAKTSGTWAALDLVEALEVPDDLEAAFDRHPGSREHWAAFPRSVRRGILEWILNAKRAPTRQRRVEETAAMAARDERANQWR